MGGEENDLNDPQSPPLHKLHISFIPDTRPPRRLLSPELVTLTNPKMFFSFVIVFVPLLAYALHYKILPACSGPCFNNGSIAIGCPDRCSHDIPCPYSLNCICQKPDEFLQVTEPCIVKACPRIYIGTSNYIRHCAQKKRTHRVRTNIQKEKMLTRYFRLSQ